MKLDATLLRYMEKEDFRVLTAVKNINSQPINKQTEMGSRNHEVVPTQMISSISRLSSGGVHKVIQNLARNNLISKVCNAKYDGYRLTFGGYDFLAIHALNLQGVIESVGREIGVGKESDVLLVQNNDEIFVLKIHRLGRTSFRSVKNNRDYLGNRKASSWMYLSRLSAKREFEFAQVLHEHGFPVPKPVAQNRHVWVMEYMHDYVPMYQVDIIDEPQIVFDQCMGLICRLARNGLIHGDFNEFNLLLKNSHVMLIDFPQMVSIDHENAQMYFDRDVECVRVFFERKCGLVVEEVPCFEDIEREGELDVLIYGKKKKQKERKNEDEDEIEIDDQNEDEIDFEDEIENEENENENEEYDENNENEQFQARDHDKFTSSNNDLNDLRLKVSKMLRPKTSFKTNQNHMKSRYRKPVKPRAKDLEL